MTDRFVHQYFSTHHRDLMPSTPAQWTWVLERIGRNFGRFVAPLPRDAAILDVPCGVGYLEHYLLPLGFTRIRALDASTEQLTVARATLRERGLPGESAVDFAAGDAFEDLERGHRYALVAAIDFLEHLTKPLVLRFLDLCRTALEPGGLLLLRVSNAENPVWGQLFFRDFTHETPFTRWSLKQCLTVAGFEVMLVDFEDVPPLRDEGHRPVRRTKEAVRRLGLAVLGRFLDVPRRAFTEDLVAVARRP